MRTTLILSAAALAVFATPVFAQSAMKTPSQQAKPVMPAPREPTNPNADMKPMNNGLTEGRAAAGPVGETVPNGNVREKARSGANGS